MKTSISTKLIGVAALLCSSVGLAATVEVRPSAGLSNTGCCDATMLVGTNFSVTIHGDNMPANVGPSLGLSFDSSVVQFVSAVLPATGPYSAASGAFLTRFPATGTPTDIFVTPAGSPSGSFDAFVINFFAFQTGDANIRIIDDCDSNSGNPLTDAADCAAATRAWFDDPDFNPISIAYTQATVRVVPVPAAAWLLVSALGGLGGLKRLRRQ
jgi:hypothetical protein